MDLLSTDVLLHMLLEAIGGFILWRAYKFCSHWHHRILIWFIFAYFFSVITVKLVG